MTLIAFFLGFACCAVLVSHRLYFKRRAQALVSKDSSDNPARAEDLGIQIHDPTVV